MPFILWFIVILVAVFFFKRRKRSFDVKHIYHHYNIPAVSAPIVPAYDLELYKKKPFLFDTNSEFRFFFVLSDVVGPDYCVFPQINYSHLILPRSGSYYEDRRYRSHIERKSADFVICDRKTCVPRLVVNLDGSVHDRPDVREKDAHIDEILNAIGLPIIRLNNSESGNRELVKQRVLAKLLRK